MTEARVTHAFVAAVVLWVVMVLDLSPATSAVSGLLMGAILVAHPWIEDRRARATARRHELQRLCAAVLAEAHCADGELSRGSLIVRLLALREQTSLASIDEALAELELRGLCIRDAVAWTGAELLRFPGVSSQSDEVGSEPSLRQRQPSVACAGKVQPTSTPVL